MARLLLALIAFVVLAVPAQAVRIVSQVSNDLVEITSSFDGERLTFFGTIAPDAGSEERSVDGPFHIVIAVVGPTQTRVARQMTHNFGIWFNTDEVAFQNFPSFFHVLSSGRLREVTDITTLTTNYILPEALTLVPTDAGWWRTAVFGRELVRLMTQRGLFGVNENGVNFLAENFYSARLTLPSDAPPGPYVAQIYAFKNGELVARQTQGFAVRKIGFERFLAISAAQQPFVYGLFTVLLALFTGWLGGVLFKR